MKKLSNSKKLEANKDDLSEEFHALDEVKLANAKVCALANRRSVELLKLLGNDMITCESMIEQASCHEDPRILSQLLARYVENPRHYSMQRNALFLKHIGRLLYHSNGGEYAEIGLKFLRMVVKDFGAKIYSNYDENCQRCQNALIQICFNSSFLIERLNGTHQKSFNDLLKQVEKITLF